LPALLPVTGYCYLFRLSTQEFAMDEIATRPDELAELFGPLE